MPAVKITKFLGVAPKIAPELLPDSAAQIATNVNLSSGDLDPYREPLILQAPLQSGTVKTIYPLRNPDDSTDLKWLSWLTDVDVVRPTSLADEDQRIYYTGDGAPKVSSYALAIQGSGVYPFDYYDLGLPLPTTAPVAVAASFASSTTASYARDTGNIATITTGSAHGLRSNLIVSITGFVSVAGLLFNATNVRVTVTGTTTFTYYNQGDAVGTTADTNGSVSLAGTPVNRTYLYTWMTPWGEESIPSEPSTEVYVREGQSVTLSSLPTSPPAGNNFVRGFRVYRTVPSTVSTTYFMVAEVWFANPVASMSRASNVVTATMVNPHNLLVDDEVEISGTAFAGTPDATYDVSDVAVLSVIDSYSFTYTAAGGDKATTVTTAGTQYWDISEPDVTSTRYYTASSFIDDFLVTYLSITLDSLYNDPPPVDMAGIIQAQNNILVGFTDNELCFSDVNRPWAWPEKYRLVFPSSIVALSPVAGSILVLTETFPYIVSGSAPESMSYARIDAPYSCVSKRGVVNVGYGVVFPTHGGLAVYSPSIGIDIATKAIQDWDTWHSVDHDTIIAAFSEGKYLASHSGGAFIFDRDQKTGGYLVNLGVQFDAAHYDPESDGTFFIDHSSKQLRQWNAEGQPPLPFEWKSKIIRTKGYINIGAARVYASYIGSATELTKLATYNAAAVTYNLSILAFTSQIGCMNGPAGFTNSSGAKVYTPGAFNSFSFNNGPRSLTRTQLSLSSLNYLTFKLWAGDELIYTGTLIADDTFRLPSGYKTDTFELSVSGTARVAAIHISETPYSLRTS